MHEHGEPSNRKLAAVEVREVDAVVPLEVGFYGIGGLTEYRDERPQFPLTPAAVVRAETNSERVSGLGFVARSLA